MGRKKKRLFSDLVKHTEERNSRKEKSMAREPLFLTELESWKTVRLIDLKEDSLELMPLPKDYFLRDGLFTGRRPDQSGIEPRMGLDLF